MGLIMTFTLRLHMNVTVEGGRSSTPPRLDRVLAGMAKVSARRILKRRKRFARKPGTKRTHALSTGLTRFLSVDKLTRMVFGTRLIRRRKSGIRDLRQSLGSLRDAQELRLKVKSVERPDGSTKRFLRHLNAERKRRLKRFQRELDAFSMKPIKRCERSGEIERVLQAAPERDLPELRRELLDRVIEWIPRAVDERDDQALHRLRVRYKVYRYTIDLLPKVMTGADDAFLADLKHVQTILGEAHDWLVMRQEWRAFQEACGRNDPEPSWLTARYEASHEQARAHITAAIAKLDEWEHNPAPTPALSVDEAQTLHTA